jgi:hypothetical protein
MLYSIYLRNDMAKSERPPKLQRLPKVICDNQRRVIQIRKDVNAASHDMHGSYFSTMRSNMQWGPAIQIIDETQAFGKEKLEDLKKLAVSEIAGLACEQTIQINGETIVCSSLEYDEAGTPSCPLKEAVLNERLIRKADRANRRNPQPQPPDPLES